MEKVREPPEIQASEMPVYGIMELIRHYRAHREDAQILTILSGMADEEPAEVIKALKLAGEDVTGLAGKQSRTPHVGKPHTRSPAPGREAVKKAVRLREAGKKVGEVAKATGLTYVQVQRIASYAAEYGIEYTPFNPGKGKYNYAGIKHPGARHPRRKPKQEKGE